MQRHAAVKSRPQTNKWAFSTKGMIQLIGQIFSVWRALTFAKQMVMALFIKQRSEELFLFDQLGHHFLFLLRICHFLFQTTTTKTKKQPINKNTVSCQSSQHSREGGGKVFLLKLGVISYLYFLLLLIQPIKYIDFQPLPEIESIHLQAWSSLQPLLRRATQGFFFIIFLSSSVAHELIHSEKQ